MVFQKIAIVGVGLIGGSMSLALKKAGFEGEIVGFDRSAEHLEAALALGLIDRLGNDGSDGIATCDLVVVAIPVGKIGAYLAEIADEIGEKTLVVDVGSVKARVIADARSALGDKIDRFIPTHPIAGKEKHGPAAADADLFVDHRVVITPLSENREADVAAIADLWSACGAQVFRMTPDEHDRFFAAVSHLPHLLSYALVDDIASRADGDAFFEYAAGGFRDFTRIAASSPAMWSEICLANREAILTELKRYRAALDRLTACIEAGDIDRLMGIFETSKRARTRWGKKKGW